MTRVLIVDDKEENLFYLQSLLTSSDCTVESAHNGAEALLKARLAPPDLVVSDLLMPVMDGYTLLRHWKADERLRHAPFIVYTATYVDPDDERLALNLGADAFILKPTDPEHLVARLREVQTNAASGAPVAPRVPTVDETIQLKLYNDRLIRKLEEKTVQLVESNRALRADVARRQAVEESLRLLGGAVEQAKESIVITDAQLDLPGPRIVFVNPAYTRMTGYTAEESIGKTPRILQGPGTDKAVLRRLRENLERGEVFAGEAVNYRKDGTAFDLEWQIAPVRDGSGATTHFVAIQRDITERKRAEREIRFNEQRYRSLVEAAAAIVWDTPASGEFDGEQPGWSAFTGQTSEELRGWGWLQAIHPEDQPETARVWAAAVASRSLYEVEHRLRARDQTYRHMAVRAVPILAEDGTILQWIGVHTDVTERKKIEQQFLRAQRMESIGTLAGGIAHDLNNAFGPIITALDLLQRRFGDPDSQELISIIETSAQHGAAMVRQVLSFARGVEGQRVEAQLGHLVREIQKIARDTFPKRIEVRAQVQKGLGTVLGDPTQLHQVLMNLCVNARDAMPEGGRLTIAAENLVLDEQYAAMNLDAKPGPYLLVQVEDTGTGIPAEIVEKIFDPFFTTKEVGKGTGLGLSTTLAIVKSHGGFIRVYSEPGKGTRFSVYLPAQRAAASAIVDDAALAKPRGHGELILVVDDESAIRQITQQTLEDYGYRVILAVDGAAAIAAYVPRSAEISAVLMDMMMPVMDGPAAIRVLRKMTPKLPIIAASGLTPWSHVTQSTDLGVDHFLPKPFTAETLLKALKKALRGVA